MHQECQGPAYIDLHVIQLKVVVPDPCLAVGTVGSEVVVNGLLAHYFIFRLVVLALKLAHSYTDISIWGDAYSVSGLKVDQLRECPANIDPEPWHS